MSRWSSQPRAMSKKKGLDPIWRGVGCVVLVVFTVGGFFLAGYLLDLNYRSPFIPFAIPHGYTVHIVGPLYVPAQLTVQLGLTLVIGIVGYSLMTVIYGLANPIQSGEKDAPPQRRGGPSKPSR